MYQDILKNVEGTKFDVFAEVFNQRTGEDYKDFLHQHYIEKDMTKQQVGDIVGVKYSTIRNHIDKCKFAKEINYDTGTVMNKTPRMIEEELGKPFDQIYEELIQQGLSLTEIVNKLQLRNISSVSAYLIRLKEKKIKEEVGDSKLVIHGLHGKRYKVIEQMFIDQLGITFKEFIYQKYIVEKMTMFEISLLTGLNKEHCPIELERWD